MPNKIFGDWQTNTIYTYASLGVTAPTDTSGTFPIKITVTRADCVAAPAFNAAAL